VKDAIYFDLETFSGYLQDVGTSRSRGVEFNSTIPVGESLELRGNYTYNDTERPNGQPRQRRPEQLLNLGVTWYTLNDKLTANAYYRISRDSYDGSSVPMTRLDDFEVLDISLNYAITDKLSVYGRAENALDEKYEEVLGYNTAGAAVYAGIKFSFGS